MPQHLACRSSPRFSTVMYRSRSTPATIPGIRRAAACTRSPPQSYSDRNYGMYRFQRYDAEAAQFVPLVARHSGSSRSTRGKSSPTPRAGTRCHFYLMPSLGGKNTLRGYLDYRFHDRDMQVFSAESRWGLFTHLDVAVFADAGKGRACRERSRPQTVEDFLRRGLPVLHNRSATVTRLDITHSAEGWRFIFQVNDPFRRSRRRSGGRTEVIPFVP